MSDGWEELQEAMAADRRPKLICRLLGHKPKRVEVGIAEWYECERCQVVL